MSSGLDAFGRLGFGTGYGSSFTDFLSQAAPDRLPGRRPLPAGQSAAHPTGHGGAGAIPHATTIVAIQTADGVVLAGDRRATAGNMIASRDIEKVFAADAYSLVGFAGTAGIGLEFMRLFQVELEHYEKIEGTMLSLDGKANRLASMIRGNLGAAMQGLAVVPLFAGFDLDAPSADRAGRIFSFDVAGGVYEEKQFDAIGSGSIWAKSALKKRYRPGVSADEAAKLAVEALYDAADDDTATGGPDLIRSIFPVVMTATVEGTRRFTDEETGEIARQVVEARRTQPGG